MESKFLILPDPAICLICNLRLKVDGDDLCDECTFRLHKLKPKERRSDCVFKSKVSRENIVKTSIYDEVLTSATQVEIERQLRHS